MAEFTLRTHYNREVGGADVCETCLRPLAGVRNPVERFAPGDVVTIDDEAEIARLVKAGAIDDPDAPAPAPMREAEPSADGSGEVPPRPAAGERPPKAGRHDAWVKYAVSRGLDQAEAEGMSKEDLIAAVGD